MSAPRDPSASLADGDTVARRAELLFQQHRHDNHVKTDQVFVVLLLGQWAFAVALSLLLSPYAWAGREHRLHFHVQVAVVLGGLLCSLPFACARLRPGSALTRHVIAIAQLLFSTLLIHLSGGRIETHFHIFVSLAFLAFYRDVRVLATATVVVAADHFVRGVFFPESVYGTLNPEWWRFLEHAGWVVFEDVVLVAACLRGIAEMRDIARNRAEIEVVSAEERRKSEALDRALAELSASHALVVRQEKLAAIGKLAASVGHELRNPLSAIGNASSYIGKKLGRAPEPDARVMQFVSIIDEEVRICGKIIADLLDFARERALTRALCPIGPLVKEAVALVPRRAVVTVELRIPDDLPVPSLDKDRFRQILINLIQNGVESIPDDRPGTVVVSAAGGSGQPLELRVTDDGAGVPEDVIDKIFQPLFTTKSKGTGLGLAIVAGIVERHDGTIRVESHLGQGTTFIIELPETGPGE